MQVQRGHIDNVTMTGSEDDIPVGLATTGLLDLLGILTNMAMFGEVARQVLLRGSSAFER